MRGHTWQPPEPEYTCLGAVRRITLHAVTDVTGTTVRSVRVRTETPIGDLLTLIEAGVVDRADADSVIYNGDLYVGVGGGDDALALVSKLLSTEVTR